MGLSTPESARADAKSVTSSSKSVTHGRPHDSDDTLGASFSPALTLMPGLLALRLAALTVGDLTEESGDIGEMTLTPAGIIRDWTLHWNLIRDWTPQW